jgi:hypothetical protein
VSETVLVGMLAWASMVFAGAQLVPEHQQRLGMCPGGSRCAWDCGGSQCDFGFGQQICSSDSQCSPFSCLPGPICDGGTRTACELPLIKAFSARLVVRVDENDALCAPPGTGCNQTPGDDCGSIMTFGLRGRKPDASAAEFVIRKDVNLCNTGALPCSSTTDCNQCIDSDTSTCPRTDPVFLCNGQGGADITEADLDLNSNLAIWLHDMQPLEFMRSDLPAELQTGIPMVLGSTQQSSAKFCTGTSPRATCLDDSDCPAGQSCYAEAEYCVTVGLVKGRCIGGMDDGVLCMADSECDALKCGIEGVPDVSPLVSDDQDLTLDGIGACGGCPSSPTPSCESGFDDCTFQVADKTPGKEKMSASLQHGPELVGTDFGNPLASGGTAYNLCVYDAGGALAAQYFVGRAGDTCGTVPCWKNMGKPPGDPKHKGYRYKDGTATDQGMVLVQLTAGRAGKSKVIAKGRNNAGKGQTGLPIGAAATLHGSSAVTVELHGSDAPKCMACTLSSVLKDDGTTFKAKK